MSLVSQPERVNAPDAHQPASRPRVKTSRFRGVIWWEPDRRWVAHICRDKQTRHLGCFKEEVEAALAYDEAARRIFGEWAMPNFPTEEERAFAARWYDRDAACRFFGVKRGVFKRWVREGRITGGRIVPSSAGGGKRRVYTLNELERLRHQMFGEDKLYKTSEGPYHVPQGWLRREEACARFGVSLVTWERWEREGLIRCGKREAGNGPKLYREREIESLVRKHGFFSPPYPDPDRQGVYRVPLGGRDINRREALIDADCLHLIEGGSCSWGTTSDGVAFVALSHPDHAKGTPLRRIIMGVVGRDANVGHNNGDPLDCRRENLSVKTTQQRARGNRKMGVIRGKPASSRYKGVTWDKQTSKWRAVIRLQGKGRSLGRFKNEVDAAQAYDAAARRFFGRHAWLNFPQEGERGYRAAEDQGQSGEETMPLRTAA